jgi:hypothetical protein
MTNRRQAGRQSQGSLPTGFGKPQTQVVKPVDWVAPVGGWRTDVTLVEMPPTAAATLVNFFPETGFVRARNGSQPWLTGLIASVQTLMPYSGLVQQLFAAAGTGIYDATLAGPVGASAFPVSNAYLSFANFTNAGGHWLVCVNGVDTPFLYNGTTWATTAITGTDPGGNPLDPTQLFVIANYRERLYFLQRGTTNLWFMPTDAITGAAQAINLGDVMRFGGLPIAINVWTEATVNGVQQQLCILTSEGELIIYQGSDPTTSTNFGLTGTFKLGYPLGLDRSMYQVGGDLAIMTVDGIVPASQAITLDPASTDQSSMTKAIAPTWLKTVESVGRDTIGWQFITYPGRRMAIVNVPDPAIGVYQFVMNAESLAWTLFSGMPATSWAVSQGNLFFGTATSGVWQGDTGSSDNTAPIDCLSVGAWQRMGDGLAPKNTTLIGIDCIVDSNVSLYAGASFDYATTIPSALGLSNLSIAAAKWDIGLWDSAEWSGISPARLIADASGEGVVFAPTVRALIKGSASITSNCQILGGTMHVQMGAGI